MSVVSNEEVSCEWGLKWTWSQWSWNHCRNGLQITVQINIFH